MAVLAGLISGWATARLSQRVAVLRSKVAAVASISLAVFVSTMGTTFIGEALRYTGRCSGWQERGSHPCGFWTFVFQDWDMALLFGSLPMSIGIFFGATVLSAQRARRGPDLAPTDGAR
ncbi:MAG: hypothetical protein R3E87_21060 [Burkholderiaceae bacterium]